MNQADYLDLEMALARVMARQEAAGFKLDLDAAERISEHLNHRFDQITGHKRHHRNRNRIEQS